MCEEKEGRPVAIIDLWSMCSIDNEVRVESNNLRLSSVPAFVFNNFSERNPLFRVESKHAYDARLESLSGLVTFFSEEFPKLLMIVFVDMSVVLIGRRWQLERTESGEKLKEKDPELKDISLVVVYF